MNIRTQSHCNEYRQQQKNCSFYATAGQSQSQSQSYVTTDGSVGQSVLE
jgi:hypothetical protein